MMSAFVDYAMQYRQERGVRYFIGVITCSIMYSIGVILELFSDTIEAKQFFRYIEQTSLLFIIPFMVLLVLDLTGRDKLLRPTRITLLFLPFILWSLVIWSDSKLHLVYRSM